MTVPYPDPSPEPPQVDADEFQKLRYQQNLAAWLERWKLEQTAIATALELTENRSDADRAAEEALLRAVHDAYLESTKSWLDRVLTRANLVTASAGAVATLYTGILALVYAAKPGEGRAFGFAGLVPAVFLGLSLLLITVFAASLSATKSNEPLLPSGVGGQIAERRLITFMNWCFGGYLARAWALNSGLISLGLGVLLLPLPFISMSTAVSVILLGAGLLLVLIAAVTTWLRWKQSEPESELARR